MTKIITFLDAVPLHFTTHHPEKLINATQYHYQFVRQFRENSILCSLNYCVQIIYKAASGGQLRHEADISSDAITTKRRYPSFIG